MALAPPAARTCALPTVPAAAWRPRWARDAQPVAASAAAAVAHRRPRRRQRHASAAAVPAPDAAAAAAPAPDLEADVVVLGAGIIGLATALALLRADPALRVALLDAKAPCAGATGAGQGYLWLAHRDVGSPAWDLAVASKRMWQALLAPAVPQLTAAAVEWQGIGSMLIACTPEESDALAARHALLAEAGLDARLLSAAEARAAEPALQLAHSALLVPGDAQVNGRASAAALLRACEACGPRFSALFGEGARRLEQGPGGRATGVQTEARRVHAARGVVVAMGAWTSAFLAASLGDERWADAFRPRRGLLLEMPRPAGMPAVQHGLMELFYAQHYSPRGGQRGGLVEAAGAAADTPQQAHSKVDITFTATTSAAGTLLVGSSREFAGFEPGAPEAVVDAIMHRAALFLPGLAAVRRQDIQVRAGPRPYATAGTPWVCAVPGHEGLIVAAGHEGSGLTLAPATAALVCEQLLGTPAGLPQRVVDSLSVPLATKQ